MSPDLLSAHCTKYVWYLCFSKYNHWGENEWNIKLVTDEDNINSLKLYLINISQTSSKVWKVSRIKRTCFLDDNELTWNRPEKIELGHYDQYVGLDQFNKNYQQFLYYQVDMLTLTTKVMLMFIFFV